MNKSIFLQPLSVISLSTANTTISFSAWGSVSIFRRKRMTIFTMSQLANSIWSKFSFTNIFSFSFPFALARSTLAMCSNFMRIFICKLMSVNAMGRCRFNASPIIFTDCNNLQMVGINASFVSTKVIQNETFGYRSFVDFIGKSMSDISFFIQDKLAISTWYGGSLPKPTRFCFSDFRKKSVHTGLYNKLDREYQWLCP